MIRSSMNFSDKKTAAAINCPVCDATISGDSFIRVFLSAYSKEEYKLYRCPICHLEFWFPLKVIAEFYEHNTEGLYHDMHSGVRNDMTCDHKMFFADFKKAEGRLLDIGCGDGIFLQKAREIGFDAWGIDMDKNSVAIARGRGLEHVYRMKLDEFCGFAKENQLKFSIVTFFEVLEHQDDPQKFIHNVKSLLEHDGYIAGSVPNKDRLFAFIDRTEKYSGDLPPHHFLWFSDGTIKYFFQREGLGNVDILPVLDILLLNIILESVITRSFSGLWELRQRMKYASIDLENKNFQRKHTSFRAYRFLRLFRNIVFFPLTLIFYPAFRRRRGYQLYFRAQCRTQDL
jgi:SAM-dependent methyltransferase